MSMSCKIKPCHCLRHFLCLWGPLIVRPSNCLGGLLFVYRAFSFLVGLSLFAGPFAVCGKLKSSVIMNLCQFSGHHNFGHYHICELFLNMMQNTSHLKLINIIKYIINKPVFK